MSKVPMVYSYKLVRDYGFAPNPFHGICTLATCKPQIRDSASVGDIIVGCGSSALELQNRVIYIMRVSQKLSFQQYWDSEAFKIKRPDLHSSKSMAYGDNIYHREGDAWVQADSHHSHAGGETNLANLKRDTNSESVLIGEDFVYWGEKAVQIPNHLANLGGEGDGEDLYPPGRNYRNSFSEEFRAEVDAWFKSIEERGYQGRPESWR